jgi:hypothetical protein
MKIEMLEVKKLQEGLRTGEAENDKLKKNPDLSTILSAVSTLKTGKETPAA